MSFIPFDFNNGLCEPFSCHISLIYPMHSFFMPRDMESIFHHMSPYLALWSKIKPEESIFHPKYLYFLSYKTILPPTKPYHTPWNSFAPLESDPRQMNSYSLQKSLVSSRFLCNNIIWIFYRFDQTMFWWIFKCIRKAFKIEKKWGLHYTTGPALFFWLNFCNDKIVIGLKTLVFRMKHKWRCLSFLWNKRFRFLKDILTFI